MQQPVQRRLSAILAADVAGYSRLMSADEEGTHQRLKAHFSELIDPKIKEHRGRTVKNTGDGMLAEFPSVVDAVRYAVQIQRGMADRNAETPEHKRITFRIGINLGDVIAEAKDIYGDGVNITARLEALAEPGGICVSRVVRDQIRDKLPLPFEDRGDQSVKNIARPVRVYALSPEAIAELPATSMPLPTPSRPRISPFAITIAVSVVLATAGIAWWRSSTVLAPSNGASPTVSVPPAENLPRLSIVVLPFDNFGDRPDNARLTDSLTDDITTRLAQIPHAVVVARTTAFSFKGSPLGVQEIAAKLGVRYVVEGSLYRFGDATRINAQLIDATGGTHIWAGNFDSDVRAPGEGQPDLMGPVVRSLRVAVLDAEAHRLERQPAQALTTVDLLLMVEAARNHPPTLEQDALDSERLDKALQLEPRSVEAMLSLSSVLLRPILQIGPDESAGARVRRARQLVDQARSIAPDTRPVLTVQALLLRVAGRWHEAESAYRPLLSRYPDDFLLNYYVAECAVALGKSEQALPLLQKAISLGIDEPQGYIALISMGRALVRLGRDSEAIQWLRRAKQEAPVVPASAHSLLAAAYAQLGHIGDARKELAAYTAMEPWITLRWLRHRWRSTNAERTREVDGLAKAGLRDHGEEKADTGIDAQLGLRPHDYLSPTPRGASGVTTITTAELSTMLAREDAADRPVILATTRPRPDFRLPMSHELPGVFAGDEFDAGVQRTLVKRVNQLTRGDKNHPVITAGWNSERWSSRNLALQLVGLGYQNVYWYRGGFEAWDLAGLTEKSHVRHPADEASAKVSVDDQR